MALSDLVEPPRVRSLLKMSLYLQPALLPDGIIKDQLYAGRAATEIIQRVANAESQASDEHINNALHLLTAAYLAESGVIPALKSETDESGGGYSQEVDDWPERALQFRASASAELAIVLGQSSTFASSRSTMRVIQRNVDPCILRTLKNRC